MDDLISRQAAIDALSHMMDTDGFRDGWAVSRANVDCMLRALPSAEPDGEYISQQAVTESYLIDWYINSVDESEPVWTEEHIYELFNDFYLIPKENR